MNQDLVSILYEHLMPYFAKVSTARPATSEDPWWWPRGAPVNWAAWGFKVEPPPGVTTSLFNGEPDSAAANRLKQFPGSVSASKGASILICTRPSMSQWPPSRSAATILMNQLLRVYPDSELDRGVHVTDFIKFRGAGGDSKALEGLTGGHYEDSLRCLIAELEYLQPAHILITLNAASWLQKLVHGQTLPTRDGSWTPSGPTVMGLKKLRSHKGYRVVPGFYEQVNADGKAQSWLAAIGRSQLALKTDDR